MGGGVATAVGVHPTQCCAPLHGVLHAGLGEGVGNCRGTVVTQNVAPFGSLEGFVRGKIMFFSGGTWLFNLLNILVTNEEPTFW